MIESYEDFPEMNEILDLANQVAPHEVHIRGWVRSGDRDFPLLNFSFGKEGPGHPQLILTGGLHGLEKVGTHVLISFLKAFIALRSWDKQTQHFLENCGLHIMPLVNPVGMHKGYRSNGNGVDLMRNSPVESSAKVYPFVGGQRFSRYFPWYRGKEKSGLEIEAKVMCDFVKEKLATSPVTIALDLHSGFGSQDRVWFPYAYSFNEFPDCHRIYALKEMFDTTHPEHRYIIEPQSHQYTTHGDLWDYLYMEHSVMGKGAGRPFIPICLEMGSWAWVKKNPRQFFTLIGLFNPMLPHRLERTLRRHRSLLDFFMRAIQSPETWSSLSREELEEYRALAIGKWYQGAKAEQLKIEKTDSPEDDQGFDLEQIG